MLTSRREVLVFCALALAVLLLSAFRWGAPGLTNDSYQYLSAAESFAQGHGAETTIVNFDTERKSGRVPAPLTTFPPGYSFLIALFARVGVGLEQAAILVSMLSFVALVPLLFMGARILALSQTVSRLVVLWLFASSWAAEMSLHVLSEAAFTAISTAAVVLLMKAEDRDQPDRRRIGALLFGSILIGLAYWVRYAGFFLFAATSLYYAAKALLRRDRPSLFALLCCSIPLSIIGLGFVRNIALTSSFKGGNTKEVIHPVGPVLRTFVTSIYHLFFGERARARAGAAELLFVALVGVIVVLALFALRRRPALRVFEPSKRAELTLLGGYVVVYSFGMIYLGVTSVISFGTRMFYPLLPLLLLFGGYMASRIGKLLSASAGRRPAILVVTFVLTACGAMINARSLETRPPRSPDQVIRAKMAEATADGRPLRDWIDANIPRDAVLIATEAQATAYVLKRKTVALTESEYSETTWNEASVGSLMAAYGAEFLILYPNASSPAAAAQTESPFLTALLERRCPSWLTVAAENEHVILFRRRAP